jgi:hypothetical protein
MRHARTASRELLALLTGLTLVLPAGARAAEPQMQRAYDHLQRARDALERATPNKGGHRERALREIDKARRELREGMETRGSPGWEATRRRPLDRSAPWADACEADARRRVREQRPNVEKVVFAGDAGREWKESDAETSVEGRGRLLGSGGRWWSFRFRCIYDVRQDTVTSGRVEIAR